MVRIAAAIGLAALCLAAPQAFAANAQEKMETCNFGADELKLTGPKRKAYLAKCTSSKDSPRGKAIGAPAAPGSSIPKARRLTCSRSA